MKRGAMTINTDGDGFDKDLQVQGGSGVMNSATGSDKDNGLNKGPNRKLDDGLNRDVNEKAGEMPRNLVEEIANDLRDDS